MSRDQKIQTLAQHLGAEWASMSVDIGNISSLTTQARGNLVEALNELKGRIDNSTDIDDDTASTATTYSSAKIAELIQKAKDDLLGPDVSASLDTLKEIGTALGENKSLSDSVLAALAKRVRVDEAQNFSEAEREQGRNNIAAASKAAVTVIDTTVTALTTTVAGVETTANSAVQKGNINAQSHQSLLADLGPLDTDYVSIYEAAKQARLAAVA